MDQIATVHASSKLSISHLLYMPLFLPLKYEIRRVSGIYGIWYETKPNSFKISNRNKLMLIYKRGAPFK